MKLLTSVDAQIKEADDDLNEVSEQLTTLSAAKDSANGDINSAAQQIQKVLSKQLENIMWIDRKTGKEAYWSILCFFRRNHTKSFEIVQHLRVYARCIILTMFMILSSYLLFFPYT